MFTWICPQCGREVPPAYTECPDCAARAKASTPPPPAQVPVDPTPQEHPALSAPPPVGSTTQMFRQPAPPQQPPPPPPQQPAYPQQSQPAYPPQPPAAYPPQAPQPPQPAWPTPAYPAPPQQPGGQTMFGGYPPAPPPRRGLPTWLMTILFTAAFGGVVFGAYWLIGYMKNTGSGSPSATVESPAAKPGARQNPYQKFIEISGVRFTADAKKKPVVKFVVVNHSGADIAGLAGNVTIWGRTQKSEEEAAGTFSFKTDLGPFQTRDLSAPLNTKLPLIQLPDWQNVSTDIQITAPGS